jgi:hypothetical protein
MSKGLLSYPSSSIQNPAMCIAAVVVPVGGDAPELSWKSSMPLRRRHFLRVRARYDEIVSTADRVRVLKVLVQVRL